MAFTKTVHHDATRSLNSVSHKQREAQALDTATEREHCSDPVYVSQTNSSRASVVCSRPCATERHAASRASNATRSAILPPIQELAQGLRDSSDDNSIVTVLKYAAESVRGAVPIPFYSIRETATNFVLPVTTIARVYKQLQIAGVLGARWGSKTVVEPYDTDHQRVFRGLVSLPQPIKAFTTTCDYRLFASAIEEELWSRRVAARTFFHDAGDAVEPHFIDALARHASDAVIWFRPPPSADPILAGLSDRGLTVITVDSLCSRQRCYDHSVDRRPSLNETFRGWRRAGARRVAVARQSDTELSTLFAVINECAGSAGLRTSSWLPTQSALRFLNCLTESADPVIFPSSEFAAMVAHRCPAEFERLIRESRVLLLGGPIDLPVGIARRISPDFVETDWRPVARIVTNKLLHVDT